MSELEQTIRETAYQLWLESGCRDGQAEIHWLEAQRQVLATSLGEIARVSKASSHKSKSKTPSRKKRRAA